MKAVGRIVSIVLGLGSVSGIALAAATPIPETGSLPLLGLGVACVVIAARIGRGK